MTQYHQLLGVDEATRAANRMQEAAERMSTSIGHLQEAFERHRALEDEAAQRQQTMLAELIEALDRAASILARPAP